jgi:hypothetical protein
MIFLKSRTPMDALNAYAEYDADWLRRHGDDGCVRGLWCPDLFPASIFAWCPSCRQAVRKKEQAA